MSADDKDILDTTPDRPDPADAPAPAEPVEAAVPAAAPPAVAAVPASAPQKAHRPRWIVVTATVAAVLLLLLMGAGLGFGMGRRFAGRVGMRRGYGAGAQQFPGGAQGFRGPGMRGGNGGPQGFRGQQGFRGPGMRGLNPSLESTAPVQ